MIRQSFVATEEEDQAKVLQGSYVREAHWAGKIHSLYTLQFIRNARYANQRLLDCSMTASTIHYPAIGCAVPRMDVRTLPALIVHASILRGSGGFVSKIESEQSVLLSSTNKVHCYKVRYIYLHPGHPFIT